MVKDDSTDLKDSLFTVPSSPESISGDEDDSEEDMYDSLTSHTTAVEDISSKPPSATESQFSSILPYLEESTQPGQTQGNSDFTEQLEHSSQHFRDSSSHVTLPSSPPESPTHEI